MLERIVALFYIPWVFWSLPFLLALAIELYRRSPARRNLRWRHRR